MLKTFDRMVFMAFVFFPLNLLGQETVKVSHALQKGDVFKMSHLKLVDGQFEIYAEQHRLGRVSKLLEDVILIQMLDNGIKYTLSGLLKTSTPPLEGFNLTGYLRDSKLDGKSELDGKIECWISSYEHDDPDINNQECLAIYVYTEPPGPFWVFHVLNE